MRASAFCEPRAWPLVTSYSIHALAATVGRGTPCASTLAGAAARAMAAALTMAAGAKVDAKSGVTLFSMFRGSDKKEVCGCGIGWTHPAQGGPAPRHQDGAAMGRARPHAGLPVPGIDDKLLDQVQLAVKEMIGAGNDDYGQVLRPCPVEYARQWHGVVLLAVDHDGVGRHVGHLPARGGRAHQRKALRRGAGLRQALRHVADDEAAEREAAERERQRGRLRRPGRLLAHPRKYREQVVLLA